MTARRELGLLGSIAASTVLAACADRPIEVNCGPKTLQDFATSIFETPPTRLALATPTAAARPSYRDLLTRSARGHAAGAAAAHLMAAGPPDQGPTLVMLSGGGQWGAFGAGFLKGWSEKGQGEYARPDLPDAVTGVSTGAIQATSVYLGRSYDDFLVNEYNVKAQSDLVKDRGSLFFLSAGSEANQRRLYSRLIHDLDPLIDKVITASQENPNRSLTVGTVNAQSGETQAIDLIAIANAFKAPEDRTTRDMCYAGAILASAAIPVEFTQVRDRLPVGGLPSAYLDGGVRHAAIVATGLRIWSTLPGKGRTFLIINTQTDLTRAQSSDLSSTVLAGLGLTLRSMVDQIEVESIYDAAAAEAPARTYYVTADNNGCDAVRGTERFFSPPYMRCLVAFGEKTWAGGATPWIPIVAKADASAAVPASPPNRP